MTALATEWGMFPAPRLRTVSLAGAQRRLAELLTDRRGRVQWWVELTRHLDDLGEGLAESAEDVQNRQGLAIQIRRDAPHLLGRLARLDSERERLAREVSDARLLAGNYAGDPSAVPAITRVVRDVIQRVRRYQERTTEMMLDAYERDIGGE